MYRGILPAVAAFCAAQAILPAGPVAPYGDLKQGDVANCPAFGCGPAAAVNSFVFLQNAYPQLYPIPLVGFGEQPRPAYNWEVLAGDLLAGIMGTCSCGQTDIERFILGKQTYINGIDPGSTMYEAQINTNWRPDHAGTAANPIAKPSWVTDGAPPTA